ncbi:MAG: tRNA 2-thiouridine(34) synthase MnmA [Planctomycetota bacterium]|jgi:tRNA-specific 2-thiouridylase
MPAMRTVKDKVVVAMSGGVDSSVAACLLQEQGYEVMGLFMRTGVDAPEEVESCSTESSGRERRGCCSASDAADARYVAGKLGVPFYALNFERDFDSLIDYFADEYAMGRTPNPCVVCNDRLKFGKIVDYADAVGARYIATGHYARTGSRGHHKTLMRGVDRGKDQSYVLFGIDQAILDRVLFPVGELEKSEVRELAGRYDLPNRDKPDSVEICFAPDNDYARVVRERRPDAFQPGNVVDASGEVVGEHQGLGHYTIGQRRGLGIAAGKPIYVTQINVATNTVTVGDNGHLLEDRLVASKVNYLLRMPGTSFRAEVKIRYLHEPSPATVFPLEGERVRVVFDEPQRAITPGQATVFYDGDTVIGGGWIDGA